MHVFKFNHACAHVYACVFPCACVIVFMLVCVCVSMRVCVHVQSLCVHACVCSFFIHVCIHACVCDHDLAVCVCCVHVCVCESVEGGVRVCVLMRSCVFVHATQGGATHGTWGSLAFTNHANVVFVGTHEIKNHFPILFLQPFLVPKKQQKKTFPNH